LRAASGLAEKVRRVFSRDTQNVAATDTELPIEAAVDAPVERAADIEAETLVDPTVKKAPAKRTATRKTPAKKVAVVAWMEPHEIERPQ